MIATLGPGSDAWKMGSGVPLGAASMNQLLTSMPFIAGCSASAGTCGVIGERLASLVPIATSLPALICGRADESTNTPKPMLPPSRSVVSGETPRYGTCSRSRPAVSFTSSPTRCSEVPTPELPKACLPGAFFTASTNSAGVRMPVLGEVTRIRGWPASSATGSRSREPL